MQLVCDPTEPLSSTPSEWVKKSDFVNRNLAGDLIGVTGENQGVYVDEATTKLWTRSQRWESSTTYLVSRVVPEKESHPEYDLTFSPPPGESVEEATTTLEGGNNQLANYILKTAENHGRWKIITAKGWKVLANSGVMQSEKHAEIKERKRQ